jgi:endonuclease III
MPRPLADIAQILELLRKKYGGLETIPTSDPFELVLWENVAYLAPPARRAAAFQLLAREVGTSPPEILAAAASALERVTAHGIMKAQFAAKLRRCAEIALEQFGGDLAAAVSGPLPKAKRALRAFPGIGEPGAEKILLYAGIHPFLAPDSNALRVLSRLGLIDEESSYARSYAAARALERQIGADFKRLRRAHELLQHHGRLTCTRSKPACAGCALAAGCRYAEA